MKAWYCGVVGENLRHWDAKLWYTPQVLKVFSDEIDIVPLIAKPFCIGYSDLVSVIQRGRFYRKRLF